MAVGTGPTDIWASTPQKFFFWFIVLPTDGREYSTAGVLQSLWHDVVTCQTSACDVNTGQCSEFPPPPCPTSCGREQGPHYTSRSKTHELARHMHSYESPPRLAPNLLCCDQSAVFHNAGFSQPHFLVVNRVAVHCLS